MSLARPQAVGPSTCLPELPPLGSGLSSCLTCQAPPFLDADTRRVVGPPLGCLPELGPSACLPEPGPSQRHGPSIGSSGWKRQYRRSGGTAPAVPRLLRYFRTAVVDPRGKRSPQARRFRPDGWLAASPVPMPVPGTPVFLCVTPSPPLPSPGGAAGGRPPGPCL